VLAIMVSTDKHLDYVINMTSAGLHGRQGQVPGVTPMNFTSQARNVEMLAQADRYLVF